MMQSLLLVDPPRTQWIDDGAKQRVINNAVIDYQRQGLDYGG